MIREILFDTLVGMIALAILGFVSILVGPMMTTVLVGCSIVGFLLRPVVDRRRQDRADRAMFRRDRVGRVDAFPRPIGRVTRTGFRPTAGQYSADVAPMCPAVHPTFREPCVEGNHAAGRPHSTAGGHRWIIVEGFPRPDQLQPGVAVFNRSGILAKGSGG